MGLESPTFVNDFVTTNPAGGDIKAEGDNHIRNIKSALKNTFLGASRAFHFRSSPAAITGNATLTSADGGKTIACNAASAGFNVTLPAGSSLYDGWEVDLFKIDNTLNLVGALPNGSDIIGAGLAGVSQTLWQTDQTISLRWCAGVSRWMAKREFIPPKGSVFCAAANTGLLGRVLFMNGLTIGDASSGATANASVSMEGLFTLLWTNFADAQLPVSGGRGGSAAADWAAHKTIQLPDMRGRTLVGMDNMGGIGDAGLLSFYTAGNTLGEKFGSDQITLDQSMIPGHTHTGTTSSNGSHAHSYNHSAFSLNWPNGGGGANGGPSTGDTTGSAGNHTHTFTSDVTGGTGPHGNMPPSMTLAWVIHF